MSDILTCKKGVHVKINEIWYTCHDKLRWYFDDMHWYTEIKLNIFGETFKGSNKLTFLFYLTV